MAHSLCDQAPLVVLSTSLPSVMLRCWVPVDEYSLSVVMQGWAVYTPPTQTLSLLLASFRCCLARNASLGQHCRLSSSSSRPASLARHLSEELRHAGSRCSRLRNDLHHLLRRCGLHQRCAADLRHLAPQDAARLPHGRHTKAVGPLHHDVALGLTRAQLVLETTCSRAVQCRLGNGVLQCVVAV